MSLIVDNLQVVHEQIRVAALDAARDPQEITLLAVSKTFGAGVVIEAALAGQTDFGENYVQEALDKMTAIRLEQPNLLLKWHFIGPMQSNKTRHVAERFDWVHSIEREKIAQRLAEQRPTQLPPLNVCLQVNIGAEASKSGIAPDRLLPLAQAVAAMPRLKLRGLMALPPQAASYELQRSAFRQLRKLFDAVRKQGIPLDTLSMGMSADMHAAIAEGATIVRIGTAIFGKRNNAQ